MRIRIINVGDKFGLLTVISLTEVRNYKKYWLCQCDCGKTSVVVHHCLKEGFTKSCGCLRLPAVLEKCQTHGLRNHFLYKVWSSIKNRCYNPNCKEFKWYGERGITMCDEWNDFKVFYNWCIANGWEEGLEIDREENNRIYEPSNCRFVTHVKNVRNRRNTVMVEYKGENKSLGEWAELYKISYSTLWHRIIKNKMPLGRALQNRRLHRVKKSYRSPLKVRQYSRPG